MLVDSTGNIVAIEASIKLSTAELRAMALKQQQQIDSQHQLLTAKEQRLRFLKFHDMRSLSSFVGEEKLRKLRDRVETQEKKLRQLRSLRGQADLQKSYNGTLNNDLDSIRALFTEKEKELTLAVAKVEALTRQLEELRQDRKGYSRLISPSSSPINAQKAPTSIRELEKARKELSLRHQLSLQQNACLHLQRETLQQRQAELKSVDQRIFELQLRLQRRKASNLINVSKPKNEIFSLHSQLKSAAVSQSINTKEAHMNNFDNRPSRGAYINARSVSKGNIAAIEPFVHTPHDCTSNTPTMNFTEYDDEKIKNGEMFLESGWGCKKIKLNSVPGERFAKSDEIKIANENIEKNGKMPNGVEHYNKEEFHKISINNFERNECDTVKVEKTQNDRDIELPNRTVWQNTRVKPSNEVYLVKEESHNYEMRDNSPASNLVSLDSTHRKPIISVAPTTSSQPLTEGSIGDFMTSNDFLSINTEKPVLPPKPNRSVNLLEEHSTDNDINVNSDNHMSKHVSRGGDKGLVSGMENSWKFGVCSGINPESHPIKARPLTIKKQPLSEQPKLKCLTVGIKPFQHISKQTDSAETHLRNEKEYKNAKTIINEQINSKQMYKDPQPTNICPSRDNPSDECTENSESEINSTDKAKLSRKVSFDPLALLLDASLEGELELVKKTAKQVTNPSAANDEGITALHNAICAGHFEIVKFLVEFGCDVNAQDSDGWTPLHCAASCNNLAMVKFLVESGACLFATTLSDQETPAEKCEEDEEGFDGCSEYLYNVQEKLGILNSGKVYTVFAYEAQQSDELNFRINDCLNILRKGDDAERDWWWAKNINNEEGYVPRNLLGLYPRVNPGRLQSVYQ